MTDTGTTGRSAATVCIVGVVIPPSEALPVGRW